MEGLWGGDVDGDVVGELGDVFELRGGRGGLGAEF